MAHYAPLPTEEPEATIAQSDTDTDKKTSVNISASCPTNNFCTWRLKYTLLVAAIVCVFVFVAVYQTILKAVLVVAVVAIIVMLSYLMYVFMNKRSYLTTQKNGELAENEKKKEEETEDTTIPMVTMRESAACEEETLHHSKTGEEDDVEIIELPISARFQSDNAVSRTPVIINREGEESGWSYHVPEGLFISATVEGAVYEDAELDMSSTIATLRGTRHFAASMPAGISVSSFFEYHLYELKPYFDVIAKQMPADWQQLATNLGLPWAQIQAVERQHSGDCWRCCQQVLDTWRKKKGRRATTADLIQAVKETGNHDVAENLEAMLAD